MVLNFMWLKFTVIWRFFRLWSLLSGGTPRDILSASTTTAPSSASGAVGTPRSIDGSCGMYVPLGGAKYRLLNVWVIFGFVGAWHDRLAWHLLWWAAIFAAFLVPELAAAAAARASSRQNPENFSLTD